jgi:hypothetical protein
MVPCPARSAEARRTTHSSGLPCPDITYPRTPRAKRSQHRRSQRARNSSHSIRRVTSFAYSHFSRSHCVLPGRRQQLGSVRLCEEPQSGSARETRLAVPRTRWSRQNRGLPLRSRLLPGRELPGEHRSASRRSSVRRYGSCRSLSRHLVGVGVPALVGLLGLVLVASAP